MILSELPSDLFKKTIPPERAKMMWEVSQAVQNHMLTYRPDAIVKVKMNGTKIKEVPQKLLNMLSWCSITSLDLSSSIGPEDMEKLAEALLQCVPLLI